MHLTMFAEVDWSQGLTYGLIGGGVALVIAALAFFFRAMTANREESEQIEANQSVYMGSLVLGIALVIGGLYFKGSLGGGTGDSSSMSNFSVFESKEGRFKASFPGKPKLQSQSVMGMKIKMFSVEEKDGIMGVAFIDLPGGANPKGSQVETLLTSARKGMLSNMGATMKREDRIMLHGKYPGREIKADVPSKNAEMYCSIYLVDGRAYQVLILGKTDWLNSDKARKFLNSFSLK